MHRVTERCIGFRKQAIALLIVPFPVAFEPSKRFGGSAEMDAALALKMV